ncbi:MAG TPA: TolC family protein [Candidatus Kapabacteria bacterium]|nr:TolC family protein [Candidatus Kapabacteria bacterium]HPO63870.1 TolC family protein [Candidatus Kapabacteria bacterium]
MKKILIIFLIFQCSIALSQTVTLEECQKSARENSSYFKQLEKFKNINELEERNSYFSYLPQFSVEGQASYQSEVFSLPIKIPTIKIPEVAKDQYQLSIALNQIIWDGGTISKAKDISNSVAELNALNSETKLYKTKELVNTLYFSILILKENQNKLNAALNILNANLKQVNSLVENGVLLKSASDAIQVEIIKLNQNIQSVEKDIKSNIEVLETVTLQKDLASMVFILPSVSENYTEINRPEIKLLEKNTEVYDKNKELIFTTLMPKFFFFAKAGYASPNTLNFFEQDFSSFYILGLKMAWNPFDWGNNQRKREITEINKQNIEFDTEELNKSINSSLIKEKNDISKYNEMINEDRKIIEIQKEIVNEKFSMLKNGTVTTAEYISDFNSLLQSQINLETHKIMLINSKINLLTKTGNF